MDKKIINPSEMETQTFTWGRITWLHSGEVSGAEGLTFGEVIINSGQQNGAHVHPNCEEILYLISGELVHTYEGEEPYHLTPGMSIRIPAGIKHNAKCVSSEDARMVVAYSSAYRQVENE